MGGQREQKKKSRAAFAERNKVGFSLEETEEMFIEMEVIKGTKEQRHLFRSNV